MSVTTKLAPPAPPRPILSSTVTDARRRCDTLTARKAGMGQVEIEGAIDNAFDAKEPNWFLTSQDARDWAAQLVLLADQIDADQ